MGDAANQNIVREKTTRFLSRLVVSVLGILLLIFASIKIYLATQYPADQLSRFVTSQLNQDFSVQSIDTSGAKLVLKGVRLKNPAGFPEGNLTVADSVTIAPLWVDLIQGRQRFRLVALEGIKINLDKNASGVWNFSQLQQLLAAKKKPDVEPAETFIKELIIKNGSFQVQGQGAQGISLHVFNFATTGSRDANVDLAFEDAAHNRYALKGKARAGADAALDLTLTAPSLSLKDVALLLKLKNPALFEGGKGALKVNATLQKGELATMGDFSFSQLRLPPAGKGQPLQGALHFSADYNASSDLLRLQKSTLTLDNLARLRAEGSVRGMTGARDFVLDIAIDPVDLARLNSMLSRELRKDLLFGGRLSCESLKLTGNGKTGLKGAVGTVQLKDGRVAKPEQLLLSGVSGSIGFSRQNGDIVAKGRLWTSGRQDKALIEALDIPFGLTLSSHFKPVRGEIPALSTTLSGIQILGRLTFDAARVNPYTASLKVPAARLSAANSLLKRYDLRLASGTASATVELAGKSAQELSATANVLLSELRGTRGKDPVAVKKGSIVVKVQRGAGHLQAEGNMQLSELALSGKTADARFGYRFADGVLYLDGTRLSVAGADVSISRLTARIPARQQNGDIVSYPISIDMEGAAVKERDMQINNLSGRLRGSYSADNSGRWLEGNADLTSKTISWQGKAMLAPGAHAVFSRSGGRAELGGQVLGGKLAGTASFDPFAPQAATKFDFSISGADLAALGSMLPKNSGLRPAQGVLDLQVKGDYSGRDGLACRFESKGSAITLTGEGGKSLLSGAGLSFAGALAKGTLSVSQGELSAGPGVVLKLKGELAQALSPKREGSLTFSLPETSLNGLVDPFVNILPGLIQEATLDGTMAAEGKIDLHPGKKLVQGALSFQKGRMEVSSQKLLLADINGKIPFSLDLSGKPGAKQQSPLAFSRENYPRLLEQLRNPAGGGEVITVGKISFGAIELGKLTLQVKARDGLTEIVSLKSSLHEGALLGRGYVTVRDKVNYRGDLLVNGLSMRALCRTLPIEGYISGRVDGVISLNGAGKGLANLTGYAELWAREGAGEKMVVSKEFLQRLAKQKLSGFFFSSDRRYDAAEIKAMLVDGDLSFDTLKIINTNLFGVRDLNVTIAPGQNRIALNHLLESIKEAAVRGKPATGQPPGKEQGGEPAQAPATQEFKWGE